MNIKQAMLNPMSVFACPEDVFDEKSLTRDEKIKLLQRWEYDARELQVADEENMGGGPPDVLDRILAVLRRLEAVSDSEHSPPTKHGGT